MLSFEAVINTCFGIENERKRGSSDRPRRVTMIATTFRDRLSELTKTVLFVNLV